MLHVECPAVRKLLFEGNFGLEKESLRVLENGRFAHTPHPFDDDAHIVKDFCENQTEINTGIQKSAEAVVDELMLHNNRLYARLALRKPVEYLWLFSNPPHIWGEEDIPVAVFKGEHASKSAYRYYLSNKYGRYKMTFSGIHVNYSFSEDLLRADYEYSRTLKETLSLREYKDRIYLELAQALSDAGWILVAVTAASPVMDASFLQKNAFGQTIFTGMASVRCSEMGYWNEFAPIFDYTTLESYAESIRSYVKRGFLKAPSELYYPIRIKPAGPNNLDSLLRNGVSHIELRMFDLNPLSAACVDARDIRFAQLLMIWLISTPPHPFSPSDQVHAISNFKHAAHYDLKTVRMITPEGVNTTVHDAGLLLLDEMKGFFESIGADVNDVLDFERDKFTNPENRYASKILRRYGSDFASRALLLARRRQQEYLSR